MELRRSKHRSQWYRSSRGMRAFEAVLKPRSLSGKSVRSGSKSTFCIRLVRSRCNRPDLSVYTRQHINTKGRGLATPHRTLALVERGSYWPKIREEVDEYVRTCLVCQQDRRSPNLPISLSEATITEGQLPYPLGIFSPLQLRILGNHPRPKRDVVVRTSLIASPFVREPAKRSSARPFERSFVFNPIDPSESVQASLIKSVEFFPFEVSHSLCHSLLPVFIQFPHAISFPLNWYW